ncbi:MAG TPA: hypothetical protein VGO50_17755 [Pyrinomonadaceae bacterium]|jgi:hypothetical protein|nr:hypothetical protein [Pyrinomonadaceae bacterium]
MFLIYILVSLAAIVVGWLLFWWLVNFVAEHNGYQKKFSAGSTPQAPPNGFYRGTAHVLFDADVPWMGKSFEAAENLGFNIFTPAGASILKILAPFYKRYTADEDGNTRAYYFQTRTEPGLKDPQLNVVKLDYSSRENPFRIRIILDEIVEVAPEQYLGKIHVKVFPGYYSTIGYFGLKK